ncbi:MAG TPA: hypothetical protein PLY36_08595 [Spirochaetota bacterium]|nr:hypothetical protein [Spirochaetota bacterium]
MDRLKKLQEWSIYEYGNVFFIEPEFRHEMVMERINDVIDTYKPKVVVKAGLGAGKIVLDLINGKKGITLVVVEQSLRIIEEFIKQNSDNPGIKDIGFINGDFSSFPVDYYAADLIISIDNLDFQETAPVVDEFKRALQFDAHFLFAGIVLDDEDIDGTYDDFMRILSPLHNDYYLKDDLKTFMNLKDFTFVKGKIEHFDYNIDEIKNHIKGLYGEIDSDGAEKFITENSAALTEIYKLNGRSITLPYFTGVFTRRKA